MRKITVILTLCSLIVFCDGKLPTGPTLTDFGPRGPTRISPMGFFEIYAHDYGRVTDDHLEMADKLWLAVCDCVGFNPHRIKHYSMLLWRDFNTCGSVDGILGCYYHYGKNGGHISVVGGLEFVANQSLAWRKKELERIWRHEMIHLIFSLKHGEANTGHDREEWSCQHGP